MRELVGNCDHCQEPVYCQSGFFEGNFHMGKLLCEKCFEEESKE